MTEKLKRKHRIFSLLSLLASSGPTAFWIAQCIIRGDVGIKSKLVLGFTLIAVALLYLINISKKYKLRSPLFILLVGIYYSVGHLAPIILSISIGVVIDEFVFSPIARATKERYIINKEIDKRGTV